jgi:ferrochelatase
MTQPAPAPSDTLPPAPQGQPQAAPQTALVLLNLGGPTSLDDVGPFLHRLLTDREMVQLPAQRLLGPWIARMRTATVRRRYAQIGGRSPLSDWTLLQGQHMATRLQSLKPSRGPFRPYLAMRHSTPSADDALRALLRDGCSNAVAFSMYPYYSDTTTGSSVRDLRRAVERVGASHLSWSVVDRWGDHPAYITAVIQSIQAALDTLPAPLRADATVILSAHSLPMRVIERGDPYRAEVEASVTAIQSALQHTAPVLLAYQSSVGPVRWLEPSLFGTLAALDPRRVPAVVVCPLGFNCEHIETLYELDVQAADVVRRAGIPHFRRACAPNLNPSFLSALAGAAADSMGCRGCQGCGNGCHDASSGDDHDDHGSSTNTHH